MQNIYYDGTKLLSMKDINGKEPEILLCTTNRSGGKTTFFGRYLINRFKKYGEKFGLIYRYNYELDDCADKFFKDLSTLFFNGEIMTSKRKANGIYHELWLEDKNCGYAIALNNADTIKKYSHLFSDIDRLLFDEFQSENNKYCKDEIKKFISIHTSIARGQKKQVRKVPVIMLSNSVTIINPYYIALGISERLTSETKFLKGDGYVLEQGFVDSASKQQKESSFNRAFSKDKYTQYSSENIYLNDSASFIEKPKGKSRYVATLKYNGTNYAIREYSELGIMYCDDKADNSFSNKLTVTTDDHEINYVMLKSNSLFINTMRYFFEKGAFRFKDLKCKECILKCLSY